MIRPRRRVPRGDPPVPPPPIEDDRSPPRRRRRQRDIDDVDDPIDGSSSSPWWRRILHFDPLRPGSTSWRDRRMSSSSSASARVVRHYGADVRFAPGRFHYSADELEPHRRVGDPEVDGLLEYLASSAGGGGEEGGGGGCGAFDDVVGRARDDHARWTTTTTTTGATPSCAFYGHYHEGVPTWVEYDAIQRGIDVFLAYLPAAGCALFYRSLIARVLVATGYLVPRARCGGGESLVDDDDDVPRSGCARTVDDRDRRRSEERLVDTGGFLACCFAPHPSPPHDSRTTPTSPPVTAASLRPGGRGWEAALRVRVLHAKVRRSLLRRRGGENAWDVEAYGVPINQEDTAATLLAFSVNVLLGIEIAAGRPLRASEQRDYLALWRYIGWLLGVDTPEGAGRSSNPGGEGGRLIPIDPCGPRKVRPREAADDDNDDDDDDDDRYDGGSSERYPTDAEDDVDPDDDPIVHSYATLESVILHLLHPDRSSRELVKHMLGLGRSVVFRSEVCRKFLGDPLSDELGMPKSRWESLSDLASHARLKFLLYVFLVFLRCYTLLTMTCPWFRRRAIVWHGMLEWRGQHQNRR
ncbi:hypothetical protein ACHAW5_008682 [Stephanodiscus triporus]|uniref:ER-bound oxygenase mpaB/mpaB'/Rubber oxygenase catalytic domain-containing protein n=1 Tax=Stephanodiscus triporus TaxID=2934178 RepID=A0ABD3QS63_9STRA